MILSLYLVLIGISVFLITIGLIKPTESAQALIGFFLLFLLSLIILTGGLQYETGANISTSYTYTGDKVSTSDQEVINNYDTFNDTTSHRIGYYLAIASAIGFIGVLYSVRRSNKRYD